MKEYKNEISKSQNITQPDYFYEVVKSNNKPKGMFRFIIGMLVISLVGGTSIGGSYAIVSEYLARDEQYFVEDNLLVAVNSSNYKVEPIVSQHKSISDIAADVGPSIVSIVNNQIYNTKAGQYLESGLGSGVIFEEDEDKIYIMSNAHVVEGATNITVNFLGNCKVEAHIVGLDTITDIAVVSVDKTDVPDEIIGELKIAPLGDSDAICVGELAIAIGTPLNEAYSNTVTVGIISAVDRKIAVSADNEMSLIQTDAAINPGNSGGALIGPTGEVIGINTIKLVDSDIEGMGFAIPINDVKEIVDELMEHGRVLRPSLGIYGYTMTQDIASMYELAVGVYIEGVIPGSGADIAGIEAHDIILEFAGEKVTTVEDLVNLIEVQSVGDMITVRVLRGNLKYDIEVILTEQ
ncbi:MAG: hypothetical protein BEN18_07680 [Epulopiscium sp. Nuni2H_MBin001]|nr:MAG: hypothetical protein BEN18_07680 [Epulopiscium sp. Nuni2H_MBin001]